MKQRYSIIGLVAFFCLYVPLHTLNAGTFKGENLQSTCPPDTVQLYLNANGNAVLQEAEVFDAACSWPCSSGNCNRTFSQEVFSCSEIGFHTVTVSATDDQSNPFNGSFVVEVLDTLAPDMQTRIVAGFLNALGTYTVDPYEFIARYGISVPEPEPKPDPSPGVENDEAWSYDSEIELDDNCGNVTLELLSPPVLTCDDLGQTDVIIRAVDDSGNATIDTTTLILRTHGVTVLYTQEVTVLLGSNGTGTLSVSEVDAGTTNICNGKNLALSLSQTTFTCADLGQQQVTFIVDDPTRNGDTEERTVTVNVVDKVIPDIKTLVDVQVSLASTDTARLYAADIIAAIEGAAGVYATDNCELMPFEKFSTSNGARFRFGIETDGTGDGGGLGGGGLGGGGLGGGGLGGGGLGGGGLGGCPQGANCEWGLGAEAIGYDPCLDEFWGGPFPNGDCGGFIQTPVEVDYYFFTDQDFGSYQIPVTLADASGNEVSFEVNVIVQGHDCAQQLWAVNSGAWNSTNTWSDMEGGQPGNFLPCSTTNITIKGYTVTFDQDSSLVNQIYLSNVVNAQNASSLIMQSGILLATDQVKMDEQGTRLETSPGSTIRVKRSGWQ